MDIANNKHCNKVHNNLKIELINGWHRKFVRQKEKYSLVEKKELGELDKNVTAPPSPLNSFCYILHHHHHPTPLIKAPLFIWDRRVVALQKISF